MAGVVEEREEVLALSIKELALVVAADLLFKSIQ
jgi:hypothetical protein